MGSGARALAFAARNCGRYFVLHRLARGISVPRADAESTFTHPEESMGRADRGLRNLRPFAHPSRAVSELEVRGPCDHRRTVLRARLDENQLAAPCGGVPHPLTHSCP